MDLMLIHQLAEATDTPAHTIRYYEKYGLFKGRKKAEVKSNNYTYYDKEVVEKLELIKEAKAVGFTLGETKELLDAWYSKRLSEKRKLEILQAKMVAIDARIGQLHDMKRLLEEGIADVMNGLC